MFCPNCNSQFPDGANFCPYCAMPLNAQYNQNPESNAQQAQYNQAQYTQPPYYQQNFQQPHGYPYGENPDDVPSTALNVVAFFVPVVGLILYLLWKDQYPKKAKKIGKAALASVIVSIIFYVLFMIVWFALFFGIGYSSFEYML